MLWKAVVQFRLTIGVELGQAIRFVLSHFQINLILVTFCDETISGIRNKNVQEYNPDMRFVGGTIKKSLQNQRISLTKTH